ncbi:MAG: WG repeat-containing protein [Muribaculaceae bacterium]|nr:WG repeat-containing protein [Muribaculaceae bacterium]
MNNILRLFLLVNITLSTTLSCLAADKNGFPTIYSENVFDNSKQSTKYGYILNNKMITDLIFEKAYPFSANGLALVKKAGYYGYIKPNGEYFLQTFLRDARSFDEFGLAAVKKETKWGLINGERNIILKEIFDKIEPFQPNGLAIVKYENKYGLVDTLGNVVLPVIYDKIENFDKSGYATIKDGNRFGIVDKRGRAVITPEHKDKKGALAALNDLKSKMSKPDITLADISKINNVSTTNINAEAAQTQTQSQLQTQPTQPRQPSKQDEDRQKQLLAEKARKEEEERLREEEARKEEQRLLAEKARKEQQEKARREEEQRLLAENARKEEDQRKSDARKLLEPTPTLKNYIAANLGDWNAFLATKNLDIPSEENVRDLIEAEIGRWQVKGEFEPTAKWKERVNETTRTAKINELADSILGSNSKAIESAQSEYRESYQSLVDRYCDEIARKFEAQNLEIKPYDADNETFLISTDTFGDFLLPVPLEEAPGFKQEWDKWKTGAIATFVPNGDDVALKSVKIGKYTYDSDMDAAYAQVDVDYNFRPVDVAQINSRLDAGTDLAMNTPTDASPTRNRGFQTEKIRLSAGNAADVDSNIPQGKTSNANTFAVVIANGDYAHASKVDHAENDGRVMTQYLTRTLGIPESNVATFINATYGQMASAISMLQDIGDAYRGSDFNLIFYYVGHGLPDDEGKKSYILPVDIDPRMVSICIPLEKIYADLGTLGAKNVTVMVDACFSGTNHGEGMLVPQSMGVAMKPKSAAPVGNMVVLAATDGNETAFPYEEKSHGLFTYWLLKKLQETSGQVTFGELSDYVIDNVKKTSVTVNRKPQTPTVATSPQLADSWRAMKFGN